MRKVYNDADFNSVSERGHAQHWTTHAMDQHSGIILVQLMAWCHQFLQKVLFLIKLRLYFVSRNKALTHWGRVTHICVSKLTIIGSDNGLSPGQRQAIIWTNAVILLIRPLGTKFSKILVEIYNFSFKKMHLKRLSAKWWPFYLDLNVLTL